MPYRKKFVMLFMGITAVTLIPLAYTIYIYLNFYAVLNLFKVSIQDITFEASGSKVFIQTKILLQNPSHFDLKLEYIYLNARLNGVQLTDPRDPPYLSGILPADYVTLLPQFSNTSVTINFDVPIGNFPINSSEKSWYLTIGLIMTGVPLVDRAILSRSSFF